jgi:hypothetical protein
MGPRQHTSAQGEEGGQALEPGWDQDHVLPDAQLKAAEKVQVEWSGKRGQRNSPTVAG